MGNDPTNLTDPTGMCPWCVGALVGGVLQAAIEVKKGSFKGGFKSSLKAIGKIGISAGAGATGAGLATKAAQLGSAVKATSAVGKLAGGAVGAVSEGAVAGGIAGGLNEAGQQVVESGTITDSGAIGDAAKLGAVIGGGAGALQAGAQVAKAARSGAPRTADNFKPNSTGFSGGVRPPDAGKSTGLAAGAAANTAGACAADENC